MKSLPIYDLSTSKDTYFHEESNDIFKWIAKKKHECTNINLADGQENDVCPFEICVLEG